MLKRIISNNALIATLSVFIGLALFINFSMLRRHEKQQQQQQQLETIITGSTEIHAQEPKWSDEFHNRKTAPYNQPIRPKLKTEKEDTLDNFKRSGQEFGSSLSDIRTINSHSTVVDPVTNTPKVETPVATRIVAAANRTNEKLHNPSREMATTVPPKPKQLTIDSTASTKAPETTMPPNTSISTGNLPLQDFSACLLVMDDNHRLVEFLAYHSFVLPLNYVVIAVDPRSKTSPTPILDRFRRLLNMTIHEWQDQDYGMYTVQYSQFDTNMWQTHFNRQNIFYKQCAIHMKEKNRTWVTFHDTDEYLTFNHPSSNLDEWERKRTAERANATFKIRREAGTRVPPQRPPPPITEYGSLGKYLIQESDHPSIQKTACIAVPRMLYGSQEINQTTPYSDVLDTVRYKFHGERDDHDTNGLGKVIIRMDKAKLVALKANIVKSPHRPYRTLCPSPWVYDSKSLLRINHYIGSWEAYSFRDDARRGKEKSRKAWERKSSTTSCSGDDFTGDWIYGFLKWHGESKAAKLLEGAGLPKNYTNTDLESWKYKGPPKDQYGKFILPPKEQVYVADNRTETTI